MGAKKVPLAKLPVVISVPHGGTVIPKEVVSKCKLDFKSILLDGDTWSRELYAFRDDVIAYVDTLIARVVLDMNRAPNDRPPDNPDGIVKTFSVDRQQVWLSESGLPENAINELTRKYYSPSHQAISNACRLPDAVLGIDCHTMLPIAPNIDKQRGEERPLICISNRGDFSGNPIKGPITAPTETVLALKDALKSVFAHLDIELKVGTLVSINNPFSGGYITWHHGINGPLPWIQLEINRSIYMPLNRDINENPDVHSSKKINDIRTKLVKAFKMIL